MARTARFSGALLLSVGVLLAATGWLYVLRRHVSLPGPRLGDALPLDELSHRGSVALVLYLAVWGTAAVLLALLARGAGAERLTAGLLLGPGVGAWLYVVNGLSIVAVRQIPAHEAFQAAASEQAVALPAIAAGVAGALLGRSRTPARPRSHVVLACLVAGVGVLAAVNATFPEHRRSLVTALDAAHVHGLSKALVAPLAAGLVVAARSLARGSRRAWEISVVLLTLLLFLNVERRFQEGAIVTGVVVIALLARRSDFDLRGDPDSKPRFVLHAAAGAAVVLVYGLVTLWVNRLMADQTYTLSFALKVTGRALAGMSFRGADHLSGPVSDWFPVSVFLLGWGAVALLLVEWLAPWRHRLVQEVHERELARALVATHGADTLAPFALRADKSYFFSEDEAALLAYRVVAGVAIVAGDPIGPAGAREELVRRFIDFAHDRGWRLAVLGVSGSCVELYTSLGLRTLYHGDEAVVETAGFSLDGRAIRKVRQSVHRLGHAGYESRVLRPSEIDVELREELETIARTWRGAAPERGFVMALDALFRIGDEGALFVVGVDGDGRPRGFLHFAISHACAALSLSTMPRLPDVPNGFNEWLISASIEWARDNGYRRVSLNFSPFAALLTPDAELTRSQRLQATTLRALKGHFQLDNLLLFNRKFFPEWEPRFVAYERRRDLPRVGVAALSAEAYLPFQ
jgi:lysyl-tRNA synthetase, class II